MPKKPVTQRQSKSNRTLSREDLGNELDLHPESIKRHHSRSNPPPHDREGTKCLYNVAEYRAWMKSEGLTGEQGRQSPDSPDLEAARLRKENALASRYELQNKRELGILVEKEDYRRHWKRELSLVVSKFRSLGDSIAPQLVGQDAGDIAQRVNERVEQIFRELSE